jgi:hypothetical protein
MPDRLRAEYGLPWDPARRLLYRGSREWVKRVLLPVLPDAIRSVPAARDAE